MLHTSIREQHRRRHASRGATSLLALIVAVLASFTAQNGTASAVAVPTPKTTAATSGPATPKSPKSPKSPEKKAAPEALHATAAREIGRSDAADTCSGAIESGMVYTCSAGPEGGASFTFALPNPDDLVFLQVVSTDDQPQYPTLIAPDGSTVTCDRPDGAYGAARCPTSRAGTYTVQAGAAPSGFSVSYTALLSGTSCTAVSKDDTALGAPKSLADTLTAGSAGHCFGLPSAAGDVLRSHLSAWQVTGTVYDATGTEVCTTRENNATDFDCTLKGNAPFRVLTNQSYAASMDYSLTSARLSAPAGCPTVQPLAYGTVPDATSTARCRVLHVPASGPYLFDTVGDSVSGSLYATDGTSRCTPTLLAPCTLTSGDYTWARDGRSSAPAAFGVRLYATNLTQGCTAVRDDGFASGAVKGAFGGPGEQQCLSLPTATGHGLYLIDRTPDGGVNPSYRVFDAKGIAQCDNDDSPVICKLTGTAPFHAVLSGSAAGEYQLAVQDTGKTAGCTAWPQSAFDGTWGVSVPLTSTTQAVCLGIAADQHSTAEMFDYTNNTNRVNAAVRVFDGAGNELCTTVGGSTTTCRFTAGVGYTALLTGTGASDTYKLVRRDISSTAKCAAPASLTVGGASTSFTLDSALDSRCLRVTAAATDKLWMSARTPTAARNTGVVLKVVDASGTSVCRQWGVSCRVTGSTSYIVIILASGYDETPISAHVDTWRVGTASGWAPECTANKVSPQGFSVRSGTFTESATAYCAVIPMQPSQRFQVYGTQSSSTGTPWVSLLSTTRFAGTSADYSYQCNGDNAGVFSYSCLTTSSASAGDYLMLVSPYQADTPVEYSMQGVCKSGCTTQPKSADVTSLGPTSGPAGTSNQVVLHGANLTLGTQVELRSGDDSRTAEPVSVSADGTTLTVRLGTYDLPPGAYDLVIDNVGYTSGIPSPGYLPGAYTVTAAPAATHNRLVPVSPTRFLDTRNGTGAPRARVGAGGIVELKVAGTHGIPATGVTAVVMNVTAVRPTGNGHVDVYPAGQPLPTVSSVNYTAPQTIANLVTVPVRNGSVNLRNSAGSVDLLADVTGYYAEGSSGSALTPVSPTRFLDTRNGTGAPKARIGAGGIVELKVAGTHGIPATGVTAVVMNVTAVRPTTGGYITVYPDGQSLPAVSNINFPAGRTIPNMVVAPVVNGSVDLRNSAGSVDLLADVTGYFSATGSTFTPAGPLRLLDTRSGLGARPGAVAPGGLVSLPVTGTAGVPSSGVTAVVLTVTVTAPSAGGYLTVHPHGLPEPGVSNLNFGAGQTISNMVVVPVVDGRVTFANHTGSVQVIADLAGYYSS
ncbi:hypothetical protein [Streptomyces sp. NPDC096013]|uniref:hypothetical protein n=1 Tax=Streptomyces sp. NPDC096013 TaxID=3366069 RepID=UPI00381CE870